MVYTTSEVKEIALCSCDWSSDHGKERWTISSWGSFSQIFHFNVGKRV